MPTGPPRRVAEDRRPQRHTTPDTPALAPLHPLAHTGATAAPVLADVDATGGTLEIVQAGWDGYVHVWRPDGANCPGWPVKVTLPASETPPSGYTQVNDQKLDTMPAVADLDGDRKPEILVHSQYTDVTGSGLTFAALAHLHAYHGNGTVVSGWPIRFPTLAEYYGSAQEFVQPRSPKPVAADVDGDGKSKVAIGGAVGPTVLYNGLGLPIPPTAGRATCRSRSRRPARSAS